MHRIRLSAFLTRCGGPYVQHERRASMSDVAPVQLAISLQPASLVRALECLMALRHMPRELVFNHKGEDLALLFIELLPAAGADHAILVDTLRALPNVNSVEVLTV